MSWDIYIQDFPATVAKVADIPDDFQPQPIGTGSGLIAQIHDVAPATDFSDPTLGIFEGDGYSIDFSLVMRSKELCSSIVLQVRGGGNPALLIAALLDRMKLRGIDSQTGEFFDVDAAKESFDSWQRYRNQIIEMTRRRDQTSNES